MRDVYHINYVVDKLLNKLLIKQTKTRSRHPNDNALVETKNGSIIRKNMGWEHIDQDMANVINNYYTEYFNPYLNFHRPCVFSNKSITYPNGRIRKIYDEATTPYEKLKEISSIKNKNFLKPRITFNACDKIAYRYSDNEFAKILRKKELKLFNIIRK